MKTASTTPALIRLVQSFTALLIAWCALSFPIGAQGNDGTPPIPLDQPKHWDIVNPTTGTDTGWDLTATETAPGVFDVKSKKGASVETSVFVEIEPGWYWYINYTQEMQGYYIWDGSGYVRVSNSSSHSRKLVPVM